MCLTSDGAAGKKAGKTDSENRGRGPGAQGKPLRNLNPAQGRRDYDMRSAGYIGAGAIALWTGVVAVFMLLNRALDLEVSFVLWLIGLLAVTVLIDTPFVQPRHLKRVKVVIAAGIIVFGYIVLMKILEILAK